MIGDSNDRHLYHLLTTYDEEEFECPFCGHVAHQVWRYVLGAGDCDKIGFYCTQCKSNYEVQLTMKIVREEDE